jgi:phosphoribosylformimino-5-aminoimidazole carboxamide ribotide isomerase
VKQIVGGSLSDDPTTLRTNFVSERSAVWYAELYKRDKLRGGHIIMLGAGNENAAREALKAYPGGMQIGGGINSDNAQNWLDADASHVIVTSWVFRDGILDWERLRALAQKIGKSRLVLDLSCRKKGEYYFVVTDRWQKFTELKLDSGNLRKLAEFCDEFLIHAADVEGLCRGVDLDLVQKLSEWTSIPTTYAGGARSIADFEKVTRLGKNRIDLTVGSALDIFGGKGVSYDDIVEYNRKLASA